MAVVKQEIWDHEFRLHEGRPDPLYQNMMMCRDKSWMAVSKGRLSRKELLCACLHDLLPGLVEDPQGRYLSMELSDWAEHGLYEYRFFEGSFEEKMAFMAQLLEQGEPVFVGTIHPLMPFSARFDPAIDRSSYTQPNHIFVILGEEEGRYVYFDTSSIKSEAFVPYPNNSELGWIEKEFVDEVLAQLFQLSYLEWHPEKKEQLAEYGRKILHEYGELYGKTEGMPWQNECGTEKENCLEGTWYWGRRAIEGLQRHLASEKLDLSLPSWEFEFIDQGDLMNWKLTDLATRRTMMAWWLEEQKDLGESLKVKKDGVVPAALSDLAQLWRESAQAWNRLSTFVLYRRQRQKYGTHPRFGEILGQILEIEDKIYSLFKNFA